MIDLKNIKKNIVRIGKVSKDTLGWPSDPKTETYRPMWDLDKR